MRSAELQADFLHPNPGNVENKRHLSHPPVYDNDVLSAIGVDPKWRYFVRVFDTKDNLVLSHYVEDAPHYDVSHVRGIVCEKMPDGKCRQIARSFPYTKEMPIDHFEDTYNEYEFQYCIEGTILRLFYHHPEGQDGKWMLSTHRKIDATNSRWGNRRTFVSVFKELWGDEVSFDVLDKDKCYVFLVSHAEFKLACDIKEPHIYHATTFKQMPDGSLKEIPYFINNPRLKELHKFIPTSYEALKDIFSAIDISQYGGLIARRGNITFKVSRPEYLERIRIRGNQSNPLMMYIESWQKGEHEKLAEFLPEMKNDFVKYQASLAQCKYTLMRLVEARHMMLIETTPRIHSLWKRIREVADDVKNVEEAVDIVMKTSQSHMINHLIKEPPVIPGVE